jgi:spermidine/putrescine transport system permease protein
MSGVRPLPPMASKVISGFAFFLLYAPLISLVTYSFLGPSNGPGSPLQWTMFWYSKVLANQQVLEAFKVSVWVGIWSTLISTLLGTSAALAIERYRFPGRKIFDGLIHLPLIMPEIVLGLSLLIWFVLLGITLGTFSIILAHITFSVSYVIITVKARLDGFDYSLEEAAMDLGATGALMAFTLSFDDFLITFFTAGAGSDTLPLKIYAMIKFGVSPEINALSTLMLAITLVLVLIFFRPGKSRAF